VALRASELIACAIIFASCTAGTGGTPTATPSPASTASSPTSTASSGPRTCVSSSEGPEVLCELEAGSYVTEFMTPLITYTVDTAGWGSLDRGASPGNFHLFPPGATLSGFNEGTSDAITVLTSAAAPGRCTGEPSAETPQTFAGLIDYLTKKARLVVSNRHPVSVGGWSGTVMDLKMAAGGDGCVDGVYSDVMVGVDPSHGAFGVAEAQTGARLYLLHNPDSPYPLAIQVDDAAGGGSDYADGAEWYGAAQALIDTFVFTP
jgi:hypothetical protein